MWSESWQHTMTRTMTKTTADSAMVVHLLQVWNRQWEKPNTAVWHVKLFQLMFYIGTLGFGHFGALAKKSNMKIVINQSAVLDGLL